MQKKPEIKKVIIFDFDGTLADSFSFLINTFNNNPKFFGIDKISDEEILKLKEMSLFYILSEFKLNIFKMHFFKLKVQNEMRKRIHEIKVFPEIPKLLNDLNLRGYTLGILSSNSKTNIIRFLDINNLAHHFEFIGATPALFKKHTALKKIIKKYAFNFNSVLYVGDEIRDYEACKKINLKCISVAWGFNSKNVLTKHNEFFTVDNVADFMKALTKIYEN